MPASFCDPGTLVVSAAGVRFRSLFEIYIVTDFTNWVTEYTNWSARKSFM